MIADAAGRAIAFRLAPGQAHELPQAMPLLERLPGVPRWIVADRGYTSHRFREHIWDLGARPAIPPQRHEAPVACPGWIYRNRHRVENLWARLKEWVNSGAKRNGLSEADLDVFAKLAEQRLKWGEEAEALPGRQVVGEDDLLQLGVTERVEVEVTRQVAP